MDDLTLMATKAASLRNLAKGLAGGLGGAAAVGLPLWGAGQAAAPSAPALPPQPVPELPTEVAPQPQPDLTSRQLARKTVGQKARAAIGSWWGRMHQQYGRGGAEQ